MGGLDEYKPAMAMLGLQFSYAAVAVFTRAALVQGMSPRVFVVYRQAIATLVISPILYFSRCLYLNSSLSISYIEKGFSSFKMDLFHDYYILEIKF